MSEPSKITFWIIFFWKFTALTTQKLLPASQEFEYLDLGSKPPESLQLTDSRPLLLNDSYCLERITVKTLSGAESPGHGRSSYYFQITWGSKALMTSIKVESDSLNDSYCEAENKHYYYRKPLNQSVHLFPDEVHEGIRFLPIKLDCKYIITPELEGKCRALTLRYSTPVCVGDTCSCRNVNMPGPRLEGELEKGGVNVLWWLPQGSARVASNIVISIYSEDGINIKKLLRRKAGVGEFGGAEGGPGREFFQMNTTSENWYRIQGYFENGIGCRGNSTFLLLRHPGPRRTPGQESVVAYTSALAIFFFFLLLGVFFFWKSQVRRICAKLLPPVPAGGSDDFGRKENRGLWMVLNPTYEQDPYLFDYRNLVIKKEIGSGNFGVVYLAESSVWLRGCCEFAVKQVKEEAGAEGVQDFLEEINIFKLVGAHPNVVKMLGFCSAPQPLTIIMEYVPFNLLTYLKTLRAEFEKKKVGGSVSYAQLSHGRPESPSPSDYNYISQHEVESVPLTGEESRGRELEYVLDNRELAVFGLQIARGMSHLESKNIVHRDLAARNVLMDHGKVLKVSDFGMSRTGVYVNRRSKKFPLRWMSPEALLSRVYSNKSDVWSFGVVLWEIGTLGAFPYSSLQNEEVISLLEKGGHLERPQNVTAQLYSVMVDCWGRSPDDRPTFRELVGKIEGFCQRSNGYVEFEDLESTYVFPPMEEEIERRRRGEGEGRLMKGAER